MKKVFLFTDGSCLGNPGFGGYCAILKYKDNEKIIQGAIENTTNNRMELLAVLKGLEAMKSPCNIKIVSDSTYVLKGANEWLSNWIKKDFKKIKNEDLWRKYIQLSQGHKLEFEWVKGHNGHKENELCDKIAFEQATKIKQQMTNL